MQGPFCAIKRGAGFLTYQDIIIFIVVLEAGRSHLLGRYVDEGIFSIMVAVCHGGFFLNAVIDGDVAYLIGINQVSFIKIILIMRERESATLKMSCSALTLRLYSEMRLVW